MLTWSAILFAIAALGGATLATLHFRGRTRLPMPLALLHGPLAASGLVLLIAAALTMPGFGGLGLAALVIFVLAALGGFYLFGHQLLGRRLPSAAVLIHASAAVHRLPAAARLHLRRGAIAFLLRLDLREPENLAHHQ